MAFKHWTQGRSLRECSHLSRTILSGSLSIKLTFHSPPREPRPGRHQHYLCPGMASQTRVECYLHLPVPKSFRSICCHCGSYRLFYTYSISSGIHCISVHSWWLSERLLQPRTKPNKKWGLCRKWYTAAQNGDTSIFAVYVIMQSRITADTSGCFRLQINRTS